jgi:hypothetical protein
MEELTGSPLEVVSATFDAEHGRIVLKLNRDPRLKSNVRTIRTMLYPRDLRSGIEFYRIERRVLEVLRFIMVESLSAFFASFEEVDGKTQLVLVIAPPDEHNDYGIISSGNYLVEALSELLGNPHVDHVKIDEQTRPDSTPQARALMKAGASIVGKLGGLLNIAFSVGKLRSGPDD